MAGMKKAGERPTLGFQINNLQARYSFLLWPGVADAARDQDVNLIIFSGETVDSPYGYEYQHNVIYDLITPSNVDALVMASGTLFNYIDDQKIRDYYAHFSGLPIVNISLKVPGVPCVLVDNQSGMRDAVSHLIEKHGYKRIAFIQGPEGNQEAQERYQAYADVLKEKKIEFDPRLIVAGDFSPYAGTEAVRQLIDRRRADFDAIVAANDDMALGVLEELSRRKIRVPSDVAVVGFDNTPEVQFNTTPLTTVRQPLYEQARKAAELAIERIGKDSSPESIVLPTKLVVRTSCGCLSPSIQLIENTGENGASSAKKTPLKDRILAELREYTGDSPEEKNRLSGWLDELINHFGRQKIDEKMSREFIGWLGETLKEEIKKGGNVSIWHNILTVLHNHALAEMDDKSRLRAETLFQEARVLIGEQMQLQQVLYIVQREKAVVSLIDFTQKLISTLYVDELMNAVAKDLPALGITSCYIALYPESSVRRREDRDWKLPETAEMIMAYNENGRIPIDPEEKIFRTRDILPAGYFPKDRRYTMVVKPLFFREDQFGFMVFELSVRDAILYDTLRIQISSALKGSLLFRSQQKAEENLLEANEKLKDTNDKLQELDRAKTSFFENISHELRTPLTLILGPIESIISGDFGENLYYKDEIFKSMRISSARLLKLINNLLDFSKIEAGKMPLNKRRVNVSEALKFYVDTVKPSAQGRDLAIVFRDNTNGTLAWVDKDLFEKAVFNLVSNAMKFTPAGGKISIELDCGENHFTVTVKDTGIGIPEDKIGKIFERFSQLDSSYSKRYEGTGIGLAFTREIVELHKGSIEVNSKQGKGSTFTLRFPLGKVEEDHLLDQIEDIRELKSYLLADIVKEKETEPRNKKVKKQAHTILAVDDNAEMRKFFRSILERHYNVITAENGREALELIGAQMPSLVVADVMMPEIDGYELCQRIKNNKVLKHIPIILVTAKADVSMKIEGLEYKADDYLAKPFNSKELVARINNLLENRSLQIELSRKQKEIDRDFEQAAAVQRSILTPKSFYGSFPNLEIDARFIPMNGMISGDYFNISPLTNGFVSVIVADVAGHGIQAALSTMQIDVLSRETIYLNSPARRLGYINELMTRNIRSKNFFTCFLINLYPGRIEYSSAAHPVQFLLKKKTGDVHPLKTKGKIIGMLENCQYAEENLAVEKGDVLFLFTDGIFEVFDDHQKEFGEERFLELLREEIKNGLFDKPLETVNDSILNQINDYRNGKPIDDDITLIGIRIR